VLLNGEPLTAPWLHGALLKFKLKFNQKTGGAFWQIPTYNESAAGLNSLKGGLCQEAKQNDP
jgi:hypothetical protein